MATKTEAVTAKTHNTDLKTTGADATKLPVIWLTTKPLRIGLDENLWF